MAGALAPLLDLLAEDVEFEVASGGDVPGCRKDSGKQAVADYFDVLGGLVAFWRMDYSAMGGQVIAWGRRASRWRGASSRAGGSSRWCSTSPRQDHPVSGDRGSVVHSRLGLCQCDGPSQCAGVAPTAALAWEGRRSEAVVDASFRARARRSALTLAGGRSGGQAVRRSGGRKRAIARHPERSEGGMPQGMPPSLRSG